MNDVSPVSAGRTGAGCRVIAAVEGGKGLPMEYGTLKSEVWSQYEAVSQDYYHYEIITRWWKKDGGGFEWKHTLLRIDRDGTTRDYLVEKWASAEYLREYLSKQSMSAEQIGPGMQGPISEQHARIVRTIMG